MACCAAAEVLACRHGQITHRGGSAGLDRRRFAPGRSDAAAPARGKGLLPPDLVGIHPATAIAAAIGSSRVVNPIKSRPPIVVTVYDQDDFTRAGRYRDEWLDHFFFDRKLLPMIVVPDGNGDRSGVEHVAAVAAGIGEIVRRASRIGYDAERIVLVSRGWGGQVAALLATDRPGLKPRACPCPRSGRSSSSTVSDSIWRPSSNPAIRGRARRSARCSAARLAARLSPLRHAAAPNAARFLFYAPPDAPEAAARTEKLAAALRSAGAGPK